MDDLVNLCRSVQGKIEDPELLQELEDVGISCDYLLEQWPGSKAAGEAAEKQLKKEKQRLKILQNQRKVLERKARTHRLCQHGALLERYFPPDEFTDEMIRFLMDGTFNRRDEAVRDLMEEVKDIFQSEEKDKTIAD